MNKATQTFKVHFSVLPLPCLDGVSLAVYSVCDLDLQASEAVWIRKRLEPDVAW